MDEDEKDATSDPDVVVDELVTIKGEIVSMSKQFWREGWGFGKVRPHGESKGELIKITGILEGFQSGQHVSIVGKYKSGKYGTELVVETILTEDPKDFRGIRQWLIDRIPQIGAKRADEIARRYGERIWDILEKDPYTLTEINGITPDRVEDIKLAWATHRKERERYVPFYDLGLTHREARAADKAEIAADEVLKDPFALYLRIPSMSFARNEIIASRTRAPRTAPSRLVAAAVQAVKDAAYDGHTAVPEEHVIEHAAGLASVSFRDAKHGLSMGVTSGFLSSDDSTGMIVLPKYAKAEAGIAEKIEQLLDEAERERNRSGSDAGSGGSDDAYREGGHSDGRPWDGKEHDPSYVPGEVEQLLEDGPVRPDGQGSQADH